MGNGFVTLLMCCVMQRFKIMKKVVYNIVMLIVLTAPCMLMFSDSIVMVFLGIVYTIEYIHNIFIPIMKKLQFL